MTVWTIGHSTRSLDELLALLLAAAIAYTHMPGLGGLRTPRADSPNTGWRTDGFRGYADYMQTDEFASQVWTLVTLAGSTRLAMMCAEAAPDHCHRSLLSDALVVRGVRVLHITGDGEPATHAVTPWAHRDGLRLTYPPRQRDLLFG